MPPKKDVNEATASLPDSITFSTEQFHALLREINKTGTTAPKGTQQIGSFINCTSRFRGKPDEDVDAFLDAVITYKECADVSDENALRGLSILVEDLAAVWWIGVKATISDWETAVDALKNAYSRKLPPYLVFREIFAKEQSENELTEHFVCRVRSLIAQLPYNVPERMQIDMIYGLLQKPLRQRLIISEIVSFEVLLARARDVEHSLRELKQSDKLNEEKSHVERKPRPKCHYCKNFGHLEAECRKKNRNSQQEAAAKPIVEKKENSLLKCFGCQTPGYIKSNCPKCSAKSNKREEKVEFQLANTIETGTPDKDIRPMVKVNIAGHNGLGCFDTGAKRSLAGNQLYQLLLKDKLPFRTEFLKMKFANGQEQSVQARIFNTVTIIEGYSFPLELLAIPEHNNSNMLLGADFMETANIVINMSQRQWYFTHMPERKHDFYKKDCVEVMNAEVEDKIDVTLKDDECSTLDSDQKSQLNQLLRENIELFSPSSEPTPFAEHCIKLTNDIPIAVPPYRLSEPKKKFLEEAIQQMIADDIIEESDSAYASPIVLVPKPNKSDQYRVCVDYRKLNAITIPDRYPLPRLDDLLHEAKQTAFMSAIDLRSGYWQVAVRPEDRDKTGFVTPFGNYRFKRMPFGLRNAPSTFQRMMDRFRAALPDLTILVYLDDVVILSPTFEQHLKDLRRVFEKLKVFKLRIRRGKCTFMAPEIKYLGHIITPDGIKPNNDKVAAIVKIPKPKNVRELLTFLQTVSWFRKFIPGCAGIMKPLTELTKKNAVWKWESVQDSAFVKLKTLLSTAPILQQADPSQPYILRCDASAYAMGAALLQGEPPNDRPIEYASRLLTDSERNYNTTEREALAVVWATEKFRGYIESSQIYVISDHQPLKWLMSLKSPSGRLARWALKLQTYNLQIDYTPGKSNALADTLSRLPYSQEPNVEAYLMTIIDLPTTNYNEFRSNQLEDPVLATIINNLEKTDDPVATKQATERGYLMLNGVLYRYPSDSDEEDAVQVVPAADVKKILFEYHDAPEAGHYGFEKTYQKIKKRYYWLNMRRDIETHVKTCIECQRFKPKNQKNAGLLQTPVQNRRFEVIAIDLFGPLPKTENGEQWIFAVEDTCSRWIELFALKQATAEACARCLVNEIILRYGTPRRVISDNGPQFVSDVLQLVTYALGFKQSLIPAYHPEANPVERKNRDLKTQLAILTAQQHTQWSTHLASIRFAMNTTVNAAIEKTPAFLTFGRELRTPDDTERDLRAIIQEAPFVSQITPFLLQLQEVLSTARDVVEKHQDVSKFNADHHRRPGPAYAVGDKVLADVHALSKSRSAFTTKFAPRRDGPYLITRVVTPTTYEIASPEEPDKGLGTYHTSSLTPYREIQGEVNPQPLQPIRRRGRPRKQQPILDTTRDASSVQRGRL